MKYLYLPLGIRHVEIVPLTHCKGERTAKFAGTTTRPADHLALTAIPVKEADNPKSIVHDYNPSWPDECSALNAADEVRAAPSGGRRAVADGQD
jgi:hypothetical protein